MNYPNVVPNFRLFIKKYPEFIHSPDEFASIIKTIEDSALGLDGIHTEILELTVYVLAAVFSKLINVSFQAGIFPNQFKLAKVIPIFKWGN